MWHRTEIKINLVLIRHGETFSNKEKRYLGKTDEALSEEGKQKLIVKKDQYPKIDLLFVSPMKRCIETAQMIYPEKHFFIIPEWEEMNFGDFEGKNYLDLQHNQAYQQWIDSHGNLPFPNGESRKAFSKRCLAGLDSILQRIYEEKLDEKRNVGIVVHGGTIMALLSAYGTGDYFDYQVSNGDGYKCVMEIVDTNRHYVDIEKI